MNEARFAGPPRIDVVNESSPSQRVAGDEVEASGCDDPDGEPDEPSSSASAAYLCRGDDAGIEVSVTLQTQDVDPPIDRWLAPLVARIASLAGATRGSLSVAIVDDDQMTAMHEQFRDEEGTTDVLSFDLRDEEAGDDFLDGEIVICLDEARRQAESREHATRLEVLLYAVHGMLHLLGFDDHEADDFARMHAREDELLRKAGVEPVFARDVRR